VVFNKIDRITDPDTIRALRDQFPDAVFISVKSGAGLPELIARISEFVADDLLTMELRIPQSRADLIARLHRDADIRHTEYEGNDVRLRVRLAPRAAQSFAAFRVN
jgi:GTP-binding protein HflX